MASPRSHTTRSPHPTPEAKSGNRTSSGTPPLRPHLAWMLRCTEIRCSVGVLAMPRATHHRYHYTRMPDNSWSDKAQAKTTFETSKTNTQTIKIDELLKASMPHAMTRSSHVRHSHRPGAVPSRSPMPSRAAVRKPPAWAHKEHGSATGKCRPHLPASCLMMVPLCAFFVIFMQEDQSSSSINLR